MGTIVEWKLEHQSVLGVCRNCDWEVKGFDGGGLLPWEAEMAVREHLSQEPRHIVDGIHRRELKWSTAVIKNDSSPKSPGDISSSVVDISPRLTNRNSTLSGNPRGA
jgi:hypothetical protein